VSNTGSQPRFDSASSRRGLLLDRDGVINVEIHRLHRPEDVVVIPGTGRAIAAIHRRGIPVAVITNQAGIGHGLYDEAAYRSVNDRIVQILAGDGARVDGFFHCPHVPADDCRCRKPKAGLLEDAARALDLDLKRSIFVGDKRSDLQAARAVGCGAWLVRTGYGAEEERALRANEADFIGDSLIDLLPAIERALG
jgi:D-glycero-D-manno-heptose 1,7-bisphosphate phosphatase